MREVNTKSKRRNRRRVWRKKERWERKRKKRD